MVRIRFRRSVGRLITHSQLPVFGRIHKKAYYLGRWYAFFIGALCFLWCVESWAQELGQELPHASSSESIASRYPSRFWKIEVMDRAEGIKPSYLLGTMHLPDKDIVELPPHIDSVVARADSLSIEVKLNNDAFRAMADLSALNGSETLSDLIGEKEFAAVLAVLKDRGLTQYALERLKPWAAALIMNYPPPSLDPILDYALQLRFKNSNKPVYQLETAREQIQIFNQMAVSDQIKFLRYSLQQQAMFDVYLAQMKALYLADDLDGLENLTKQQMIHSDKKFMSLLLNELIDKRNLRMVDRMQQYLQKGNALIAIGALHLTGEYGVLQLLSEIGYRVSPVLGKD